MLTLYQVAKAQIEEQEAHGSRGREFQIEEQESHGGRGRETQEHRDREYETQLACFAGRISWRIGHFTCTGHMQEDWL